VGRRDSSYVDASGRADFISASLIVFNYICQTTFVPKEETIMSATPTPFTIQQPA
jgi:hypothetical protein